MNKKKKTRGSIAFAADTIKEKRQPSVHSKQTKSVWIVLYIILMYKSTEGGGKKRRDSDMSRSYMEGQKEMMVVLVGIPGKFTGWVK